MQESKNKLKFSTKSTILVIKKQIFSERFH